VAVRAVTKKLTMRLSKRLPYFRCLLSLDLAMIIGDTGCGKRHVRLELLLAYKSKSIVDLYCQSAPAGPGWIH
jgi:hypothetical protein